MKNRGGARPRDLRYYRNSRGRTPPRGRAPPVFDKNLMGKEIIKNKIFAARRRRKENFFEKFGYLNRVKRIKKISSENESR